MQAERIQAVAEPMNQLEAGSDEPSQQVVLGPGWSVRERDSAWPVWAQAHPTWEPVPVALPEPVWVVWQEC